jgi:hypothetical protein
LSWAACPLEPSRHPVTTSRLVASIDTIKVDLKYDRIGIFNSINNHLCQFK